MSAAALDLLMTNFNSQLQQESGLHLNNINNNINTNNTAQQQHGGVPQGFNLSYSQHHQQQHQQQQQQQHQQQHQYMSVDRLNSAILSPTGSPVRQLKRLHPGATNTATELLRCRRRIELSSNTSYPNMHHYDTGYSAMPSRQVSSVARRNERERNRVRLVNHGFALLRQHVPTTAARSKKMSKVDTLKAAVDYIQGLRDLLEDADAAVSGVEVEEEQGERSPASTVSSSSGFSTNQENTFQHHRRHHQEQGSLSPASSCPDGSTSPGGYSSSGSEDGASSTSCLALHARAVQYQHQRHLQGAREDDDDLHLEEFASWFC